MPLGLALASLALVLMRNRPSAVRTPTARTAGAEGHNLHNDRRAISKQTGTTHPAQQDVAPHQPTTPRISEQLSKRVPPRSELPSKHLDLVATADVRGNLGPPSVVTSPSTKDWLRDRWQAAADMNGTPIPGPHWIILSAAPLSSQQGQSHDAKAKLFSVEKVVLDFEDAHATDYVVEATETLSPAAWQPLEYPSTKERKASRRHKVDALRVTACPSKAGGSCSVGPFVAVRLYIRRLGARGT